MTSKRLVPTVIAALTIAPSAIAHHHEGHDAAFSSMGAIILAGVVATIASVTLALRFRMSRERAAKSPNNQS